MILRSMMVHVWDMGVKGRNMEKTYRRAVLLEGEKSAMFSGVAQCSSYITDIIFCI